MATSNASVINKRQAIATTKIDAEIEETKINISDTLKQLDDAQKALDALSKMLDVIKFLKLVSNVFTGNFFILGCR